jgi:hypothetical protein
MLLKILPLPFVKVLCQYRLCKPDHAYLAYLMLQRQLSHLNGRKLDRRQVKPLTFLISGVALFYTANMFILVILYDFCLLPAQFSYIIIYTWKVESRVQIADRCAPRIISNGGENLVVQALQL